jgi:hypothetical protein
MLISRVRADMRWFTVPMDGAVMLSSTAVPAVRLTLVSVALNRLQSPVWHLSRA